MTTEEGRPGKVEAMRRLEEAVERLIRENESLKNENSQLLRTIEQLKSGQEKVSQSEYEEKLRKLEQDRDLVRGKIQEILSRLEREESNV